MDITTYFKTDQYRRYRFILILILLVFIGFILRHCVSDFSKLTKNTAALSVVTGVTTSRDVPVYIEALGAVTPVYNVTIKTQINGLLMQVLFKEGQLVKQGDVLAQIDTRPYEAQLIEYQGQLERDQALLTNALVDLKRYQTLWSQDSVSQQTLATQEALVRQYEGTVKLDQGLLDTTLVNLNYCRIISPVDGRVGLRLVDPGNYVQTTDTTGIAVVTTLNPITVIFTMAEDYIPAVLKQLYAGKTLEVLAYDRQQAHLLATGKLLTIDNQIDPTTGTVKLRAEFDNSENTLFASQFVNVRLLVNTLKDVTLVPTAAIQYRPEGTYVYVVNKDSTSGLVPGQTVVTEGTDKLTDGAKVRV